MKNFRLHDFGIENLTKQNTGQIPLFEGAVVVLNEQFNLLSQTGFSFILPEKANPNIRVVDYDYEELSDFKPVKFPDSLNIKSHHNLKIQSPFNVIFGGIQRFTNLPLFSFQIIPFTCDELTLRIFKRIILDFSFDQDLPTVFGADLSIINKQIVKSVALNGDLLTFIPRQKEASLKKSQDEFWYKSGQTYIKLLVAGDRIYRLYFSDLENLGVDPTQIDPNKFALYLKGELHPVFVQTENQGVFQPNDFIEFYGRRNRGSSEFYHEYSDTSVYWVTWQEGTNLRTSVKTVDPNQGNAPSSFYTRTHFEDDNFYYNGDNSLAIFNSDRVSGEGWIWRRLFAGETASFLFSLDNYVSSTTLDSLLLKVRGITKDPVNPDHHIVVQMNGTTISDFFFDDVTEIVRRMEIPNGLLKSGENELTLQSVGDTGAQLDAIYLDWFEISYSMNFNATDNQLFFSSPVINQQSVVSFELNNFDEDSVVIYDVTNQAKLEGLESTESNGKHTITFSDSIAGTTKYVAIGESTIMNPGRIILDNPSDLYNEANQAEYLVITHQKFWQHAMELADYRSQSQGLSTMIIDIEDILDEFNFGLMDPLAIRSFVKYASDFWQAPKPEFVLFFGDATWDYKKNSASSIKNNYVPTYGNPVADNRLVSINGDADILPDLFAGRLPVSTVEEAEDIVAKIKLYESGGPRLWKKNIAFLNGGVNSFEHNSFRSQSEGLIDNYVEGSPFGGNPIRIYKQSEGRIPGELQDEILAAINSGALWFSFSGHAGSSSWELMLDNQDILKLNNTDKLPFISSMTCHTARFANPVIDSFGELFMRRQDVGAIGFWGTSGWGYIFQDGLLLDQLFGSLLHQEVETIGEATTLAKLHLWNVLGFSHINVSTIDQYTLLGDPAQKLSLPNKPDPSIQSANISIIPQEPSQADSIIQVQFDVFNPGLFTQDSLEVSLTLQSKTNQLDIVESKISLPPFGYQTQGNALLRNNHITGETILNIQLDPNNEIDEINEDNNYAEFNFYIFSTRISLTKPLLNSVISDRQPSLQVYSPEAISEVPRNYYFELDTTQNFDSQFLIQSGSIPENPIVTMWRPEQSLSNDIYFWRSRVEEEMRLSQWLLGRFIVSGDPNAPAWLQNSQIGFNLTSGDSLVQRNGGIQLAGDSLFLQSGTLFSGVIGPGKNWSRVLLDIEHLNVFTSHVLKVLGFDRFSREWKLTKKAINETLISLSELDAAVYSQIQMQLTLQTEDSLSTPIFRQWQVDFTPAADLATHPSLIHVTPDSILEGKDSSVNFTLRNVGLADVDSVEVQIALQNQSASWNTIATQMISGVSIDESIQFSIPFNTANYPGDRRVRVWLDPQDLVIELSETNNLYSKRFFVASDSIRPEIRITFDDRQILPGDLVAIEPTIRIEIDDNSPLSIADTSLVQLVLDGQQISYSNNFGRLEFEPVNSLEEGSGAIVTYRPQFESGDHVFEVFAKDATLNAAYQKVEFIVESGFLFREVMNVPNPFLSDTHFTYILTQTADRVKLSIYTIAGRKIHELNDLPAIAGFSTYHWDGLDADGDRIANGVYLYRLTAKLGEKNTSNLSKFVVMK